MQKIVKETGGINVKPTCQTLCDRCACCMGGQISFWSFKLMISGKKGQELKVICFLLLKMGGGDPSPCINSSFDNDFPSSFSILNDCVKEYITSN